MISKEFCAISTSRGTIICACYADRNTLGYHYLCLLCGQKYFKYRWQVVSWLVGCFGFNGPLRQYFSLYRAVSQRGGERGERIDESKNVQTTPTRTYCKGNRPMPYCDPNCRTPRHWKFSQHHRTTRPPTASGEASARHALRHKLPVSSVWTDLRQKNHTTCL